MDGNIDKLIEQKLAEIAAASEAEILESQHEKELEIARIRINNVKENLRAIQKDLDDFKAETIKVIRGTSKISIELLNSLVAETEQQITSIKADLETAKTKYRKMLASAESLQYEYNQLLTWGDLYRESSFEAKKMIMSQFVKAVRVGRDYNI